MLFPPLQASGQEARGFDTSAQPGVFLGWHLKPGGEHSGRYVVAMLDDFRILIAAGKPALVLVQEVKEVTPLAQEQFHFPLYSQYQGSRWSLHGGRPESRPQVEVEAETEARYAEPVEKRPPEPVPSEKPQELRPVSSIDPTR